MNYYSHHIGDFNNATRHLTRVERSIYRDLIDIYYDTEKPLTKDIEKLSKIALIKIKKEKIILKNILFEFFDLQENGYHNTRCDNEITKYQSKSLKAKKSADARWSKTQCSDDANAMRTHSERNANGMLTNNQEPITKNQEPKEIVILPEKTGTTLSAERVADYLNEKILIHTPGAKTSYTGWVKDIERAIRIDKRTEQQLTELIDWIHVGSDGFWISNIMSGKKLREKFDTINAQRLSNGKGGAQKTSSYKSKTFNENDYNEIPEGFN